MTDQQPGREPSAPGLPTHPERQAKSKEHAIKPPSRPSSKGNEEEHQRQHLFPSSFGEHMEPPSIYPSYPHHQGGPRPAHHPQQQYPFDSDTQGYYPRQYSDWSASQQQQQPISPRHAQQERNASFAQQHAAPPNGYYTSEYPAPPGQGAHGYPPLPPNNYYARYAPAPYYNPLGPPPQRPPIPPSNPNVASNSPHPPSPHGEMRQESPWVPPQHLTPSNAPSNANPSSSVGSIAAPLNPSAPPRGPPYPYYPPGPSPYNNGYYLSDAYGAYNPPATHPYYSDHGLSSLAPGSGPYVSPSPNTDHLPPYLPPFYSWPPSPAPPPQPTSAAAPPSKRSKPPTALDELPPALPWMAPVTTIVNPPGANYNGPKMEDVPVPEIDSDISALNQEANAKRRMTWTPEQDEVLRRLVSIYGPKDWHYIASFFPGRNSDNVRLRYKYCLQFPQTNKDKSFTPEEDLLILKEAQGARQWKRVGQEIGRSAGVVRNRYDVLRRLAQKREVKTARLKALENVTLRHDIHSVHGNGSGPAPPAMPLPIPVSGIPGVMPPPPMPPLPQMPPAPALVPPSQAPPPYIGTAPPSQPPLPPSYAVPNHKPKLK